jgi:aspartyl-tRNA(Asn)/glutamyl-tRNA(Gln) amidotransferase subunit B
MDTGRIDGSEHFATVVGLEIHVQLKTDSKLFCGNSAEYGATPNTHVCPVCLGLPGSLPVTNQRAVELGVRAALGLYCSVHTRSVFARKNYFYPDLPKGYQITQFDQPLATNGFVDAPGGDGVPPARVRIRRIHLEEDAGKSLHDRVAGATAIDLNRAGVPLIEIVTEPDISSAAQARAFLTRLKQALEYLDVSDCNMEEGSLRVDANVSIRREGDTHLGTKTEIKNMNSFSGVEQAIRFEVERQEQVLRSGGIVEHETLLWDAGRAEARPMRSKEESHDYRYFSEPDLPPLELDAGWLEDARRALPEMPWARSARLLSAYGISAGHAEVLTSTRELADYYEEVLWADVEPQEAANWIMGDVLAAVKDSGGSISEFRIRPPALAALLRLLAEGVVSRPIAKQVFARMMETDRAPAEIVEEEGWLQIRDEDLIQAWIADVIQAHPEDVERFRAGGGKLMGFFVGQVMRRSGGKADPRRVAALVAEALGA